MKLYLEKFIQKNEDVIKEMNTFIDDNKESKNLRLIIAGPSIFYFIKELEEVIELSDDMYKYRGIRFIYDAYHPDSTISYVMKDNRVKFNIPCICGIFADEKHP